MKLKILLNFFTEKIAKPKYVKTGTGKGRGRPPKRLAPMEENAEDFSSRISPNAYTYNCVIFCYTWSHMENKDQKALAMLEKMKVMAETNSFCRPDCTTYNAVMNCITKSDNPSAPYKVEALMEELIEIYKSTGDAAMRPTNRAFNACVRL